MKKVIMRYVQAFTAMVVGVLGGVLPDEEDMKAERVQFWLDLLKAGWRILGGTQAIERIISCASAKEADLLAREIGDRFATYGYDPHVLAAEGERVVVRLTTTAKGRVTERDFGAAVLVDACT